MHFLHFFVHVVIIWGIKKKVWCWNRYISFIEQVFILYFYKRIIKVPKNMPPLRSHFR